MACVNEISISKKTEYGIKKQERWNSDHWVPSVPDHHDNKDFIQSWRASLSSYMEIVIPMTVYNILNRTGNAWNLVSTYLSSTVFIMTVLILFKMQDVLEHLNFFQFESGSLNMAGEGHMGTRWSSGLDLTRRWRPREAFRFWRDLFGRVNEYKTTRALPEGEARLQGHRREMNLFCVFTIVPPHGEHWVKWKDKILKTRSDSRYDSWY